MSEHDELFVGLVRESGAELITSLFGVLKTLKVFALNNANSQSVMLRFRELSNLFFRELDAIDIQLMGSQFFLSGVKVVMGLTGYETFARFADIMDERGIGTITINMGVVDEELARFCKFFMDFRVSQENEKDPFDEFISRFDSLGIDSITFKKMIKDEAMGAAGEGQDDDEAATYLKTIYIALALFEGIQRGDKINFRNAKRAIQKLVGVIEKNHDGMVTLLRVADIKQYLAFHSVNVCVYSIMIAQKLGLSKTKIADIGICGLLHDVGMIHVPESITASSAGLSQEEWELIWRHPIDGAKLMLRNDRMVEVMTRAMQVAFQHQMRKDEMGYPQLGFDDDLNLFTKIIKVADSFAAMTTHRPYRRAVSEEKALHDMLAKTDTVYERIFIKMLANVLGVYPVGTTVKLNTGEIGTVIQENQDPDYRDKPVVRLYADAVGQQIDRVVNMMDKNMGVFSYWIVPFDEQELNLDMSEFISIM